jgi:putative membrane protein
MYTYFKDPKMRRLTLPIASIGLERERKMTYPLANSSRSKKRRWPLVLRFHKGSIHGVIFFPVLLHACVAALIVYVNKRISYDLHVPGSITSGVSIVVGLMLVFRNQTAYSRFWDGRLHLNTVTSSIRCITRQILVLAPPPPPPRRHSYSHPSQGAIDATLLKRTFTRSIPDIGALKNVESKNDEEEAAAKVVETVKIMMAMLYTIKNHLRADWGVALSPGTYVTEEGQATRDTEYGDLLPPGLKGYEHHGLALTLELSVFVESFIAMGSLRCVSSPAPVPLNQHLYHYLTIGL